MTDERIKGKAEEIKGKVKSAVGDLIGNEKLQAEGKMDKAKGEAREFIGDAKDAGKKANKGDMKH